MKIPADRDRAERESLEMLVDLGRVCLRRRRMQAAGGSKSEVEVVEVVLDLEEGDLLVAAGGCSVVVVVVVVAATASAAVVGCCCCCCCCSASSIAARGAVVFSVVMVGGFTVVLLISDMVEVQYNTWSMVSIVSYFGFCVQGESGRFRGIPPFPPSSQILILCCRHQRPAASTKERVRHHDFQQ